jgi:hypothetical protein
MSKEQHINCFINVDVLQALRANLNKSYYFYRKYNFYYHINPFIFLKKNKTLHTLFHSILLIYYTLLFLIIVIPS